MKNKIRIISAILLLAVMLPLLLSSCARFGIEYLEDITVSSENGAHTLIIREWGTIGGTGAEIYYEIDGKLRHIGDTIAADSCYPLRDGHFSIEWNENGAVITYYGGRDSQSFEDISGWDKKEVFFTNK